jgi:hypothetical protein
MKHVNTLLIAFGVSLLVLFVHAWSASMLGYAWVAVVTVLFLGGFIWMFLHVVLEALAQYKSARGKIGTLAILLGVFALTAVLSVFYVRTFILAIILFGCLVWRGGRDFVDLFRRRRMPAGPQNWHAVEQGQLPHASAASREQAKKRFAHSHDVRINYQPRLSDLGLSSQPLRMDE